MIISMGEKKKKLLTKFCLHDKSVRKLGLEKNFANVIKTIC